jgi:hypothetical protein
MYWTIILHGKFGLTWGMKWIDCIQDLIDYYKVDSFAFCSVIGQQLLGMWWCLNKQQKISTFYVMGACIPGFGTSGDV